MDGKETTTVSLFGSIEFRLGQASLTGSDFDPATDSQKEIASSLDLRDLFRGTSKVSKPDPNQPLEPSTALSDGSYRRTGVLASPTRIPTQHINTAMESHGRDVSIFV